MRILFFFTVAMFVLGHANAQRRKLLFSEKIDFEKQPKDIVQKLDSEMTEEMDRFLGFGFHFSVKRLSTKNITETKKKDGLSVNFGFQLPKYLKTKPPEKLLKAGWNLGLNL